MTNFIDEGASKEVNISSDVRVEIQQKVVVVDSGGIYYLDSEILTLPYSNINLL